METKNIYNLIILDESGSMGCIKKQAVSAMNETIQSIKKSQEEHPDKNYFISLVVFEGNGVAGVKTIRDRIEATKVDLIKDREYNPFGCTPLYDAIGVSVERLDECITEKSPVLVTVITDGEENSSTRFSGSEIKRLIEIKRECGWSFAYIGANQDAIEVARNINIPNALNWYQTEDGVEEMSSRMKSCVDRFCDEAPCGASDMGGLFD